MTYNRFFISLFIPLFLTACTAVKKEGPVVSVPPAKPKLQAAKNAWAPGKFASGPLPDTLGGLVQSDRWVIYKDKQEEEFTGHVSYDNGTYQFRADYALSQRALQIVTARGHVFLRQNQPDGSFYQAQADQARYHYNTQKGTLSAQGRRRITLIHTDAKGQTVTARARKGSFDLNQKIFVLEGDVEVFRPTPQGTQTLRARKATFKQAEEYLLLEGDAQLTDGSRTLEAQTIIYDGQHNASYAYGARPLAYGTAEEGTFAIIADKVQGDNATHAVHLSGAVQGWVVSPQINNAKLNTKF